jgi:hypothetical protein
MSEIKRYSPAIDYWYEGVAEFISPVMNQEPNGEWVRWEDVQELLDAQAEELRLMQDRINRLVIEPRAMTSEDILKGMDAAIRGESNRPGAINSPSITGYNEG